MAQFEEDHISPAQYTSILEKTQKLDDKVQKLKRSSQPVKKPVEHVKRMKIVDVKPSIKKFPKTNVVKDEENQSGANKYTRNGVGENTNGKRKFDKSLKDVKPLPMMHVGQDGEKVNWKEYKAEKKELKKRRQTVKNTPPVQSAFEEANRLWVSLTLKATSKSKQHELAVQLLDVLQDKLMKAVWKHDASRYIQAMISKGPPTVVDTIFKALKNDLVLISLGKYSHWCVIQLLKHGSNSQKRAIIKSFEGSVTKLMKSSIGCRVLEDAFNEQANSAERARILQELCSPFYRCVKDDSIKTLKDVLEKTPIKKNEILTRLQEMLKRFIAKNRWRLFLFHTLLYEYICNAEEDDKNEMLSLAHPNLLEMVHTKPGARIAMMSFWNGDKKVRKQLVKSLKGKVVDVCIEAQGHRILLALFDCVDDTTLVSKAIVQEMASNISTIMTNDHGKKVILYLFAGREKKFFDADTIAILATGDENPHTKKQISDIHTELHAAIEPSLVEYLKENVSEYLQDNKNTLYLSVLLNSITVASRSTIYDSIAQYVVGQPWEKIVGVVTLWKLLVKYIRQEYPESVEKEGRFPVILSKRLTPEVVKAWSSSLEGKICLFWVMLKSKDEENDCSEILKIFKKYIKGRKDDSIIKEWRTVKLFFSDSTGEAGSPDQNASNILQDLKSLKK